jgi:hypothetical protein
LADKELRGQSLGLLAARVIVVAHRKPCSS